jgi:acyl-[acyl-carrier-protein] desaturase
MLLYAVFQERATQIIYNNLHKISRGESQDFVRDADPVLAEASRLIAIDEAAHYDFFLKASQLYLYYFPEETTVALADVLRNFTMPAVDLIPNYDTFVKALYEGALFGRHIYAREVVPAALAHLGINSDRTLGTNVRWRGLGVQFSAVETAVRRLFDRLGSYEDEIGLSALSDSLC